jgi:serine/threonine protein kinase
MGELAATGEWQAPAAASRRTWPTIPGYEIVAELGRGGMGVVYKAQQAGFDRPVALKLIRDGALAGPQDRARFRIETEAVARVQHPNVVQIYETGDYDGQLYFAMEFADGGSLAPRLTGRPLPGVQAAELIRTLALAIQHAHAQQIVHRDLKPANILLKRRAGDEVQHVQAKADAHSEHEPFLSTHIPLITDFGLAKRLDLDSTAWTQDGIVLGTASYMSPEQAAGRVRDIGPAVDVYALGAIFYELLTGRPPFQAATAGETIEQVIYDEPAPPIRLNPSVSRDLETVCLKCLEKEPTRRYPSAGELADDLGVFLDGRRVAAMPISVRERLSRLAARDGYEMQEEIGRGPRSTVYRALHGQFKQPVAVKVFAPGLKTQWESVSQVRSAAATAGSALVDQPLAAALSHPNLVPLHQAGIWDGAPFVAVEYVPQGSLASRLAGSRISVREALRIVIQVAETASYIHRQGIVHGNLKPSNVLLAADGIIRIADFRSTGGLFLSPPPAGDDPPVGIGYLTPEWLGQGTSAEPRMDWGSFCTSP